MESQRAAALANVALLGRAQERRSPPYMTEEAVSRSADILTLCYDRRVFVSSVFRRTALCGTAVFLALSSIPASTQQSAAPIARYTMDAGTMSGMAAMAASARGNPLALMRGGGGGAVHQLELRLGSTRTATGAPSADHFMPAGAGLGVSVPLVTPVRQVATAPSTPERPEQGQLPSAKLYIFWGCGEHAGPGQPVVIDFSKLARGQVPPGLFAAPVAAAEAWRITQENSRTYGEWPNSRDTKQVPSSSSLIGDHRIAGNYSPDITFHLDHSFMPALQTQTPQLASGAYGLSWNGLPEATGYYAWAMGAKDMGRGQPTEMVWWTSSATKQFGGPMSDWLSPGVVARLVAARTVMPPSQTSCTIPAEVRQAGGDHMMLQLFAYGPESDFAYPPRPASSKVAWKPDWIARVRFRSNAMTILGMPDMSAYGSRGSEDADRGDAGQQQSDTKPPCPRGLKGLAMRASGACR